MTVTLCQHIDSPIGRLTIAGRTDGTVTHVCLPEQTHEPKQRMEWPETKECFAVAATQLQ